MDDHETPPHKNLKEVKKSMNRDIKVNMTLGDVNSDTYQLIIDGVPHDIPMKGFPTQKIKLFFPIENMVLCQGEIGISDFSPFLELLPSVDIVYAALPKSETFPMWYKIAGKPLLAYDTFLERLFHLFRAFDADQFHIEVGATNIRQVREFFRTWGFFPYTFKKKLLYSAPLNGKTEGMAKCRNYTYILGFGRNEWEDTLINEVATRNREKYMYSHEYIQCLYKSIEDKPRVIVDPVIGKGVIFHTQDGAMDRAKFGETPFSHAIYGIEMNMQRLECAMEYVIRKRRDIHPW